MIGWIIYNGSLKIKKIEQLVNHLLDKANKKNMRLYKVRNDEIIQYYNDYCEPKITTIVDVPNPDYVIFWDKDIMLARHLESMNIKLFNSREAIENCDNKALMMNKLIDSKIKIPKTIASPFSFTKHNLSEKYLKSVLQNLGETVIVKEVNGSFGMQVYKTTGIEELKNKINDIGNKSFIIQQYIPSTVGKDIRVNIIGDKIIGAIKRENKADFRANITLGGTGTLIKLTYEQKNLALKAHKALKLDFSGVDLLFGENGEPLLCEVNSNVNFLSFENISGIDFANELLNYINLFSV